MRTCGGTLLRACQAALTDTDQVLNGRYDKIDLPIVGPVVTRVERYAGHCHCCGGITLAPVPAGLEDGSPFSVNIVALAIYLRFTHAISYRRLTQLFRHLYALQISEGALDAKLQRAKPCSTIKSRPFSPGCAARGLFVPTRPRCASTGGPIGTGYFRTIRR